MKTEYPDNLVEQEIQWDCGGIDRARLNQEIISQTSNINPVVHYNMVAKT